jgi:hypothetical protein
MANNRVRTDSLGSLNAVSKFCTAKFGLNINISGTFVGTLTLFRRDNAGNSYAVTNQAGTAVTFTAPTNFADTPINLRGDYFLKMTAYTSGTAVCVVEGW